MQAPRLHVPIGIPGSGKSTWAREVLERLGEVYVVSTDRIREQLHPGEDFVANRNQEVFDEFHERIGHVLKNGRDVFADATNLRGFARSRLIEIANEVDATIHYIVFTNVSQAIVRNMHRERVVEVEPMLRLISQYETALRDITVEPYDLITYIEKT